MECDIFISYRRQGGRDLARTLLLALKSRGYEHVFFDYNSLRDGLFNEQIIEAINVCKDFILILSPGSMDRCVNEDDWVRREIVEAIEAGCNIIPVRIDEKEVVFPADLPRKLNIIKNIQASKLLTNEFFEESVTRIVARMSSTPKVVPSQQNNMDGFILTVGSDETCEVFVEGELCGKVKGGKTRKLTQLKPNSEYTIEFRSLAVKKDMISLPYRSPKINKEDSLSVSFAAMREDRGKKEAAEKESLRREREIRMANKQNLHMAKQQYEDVDVSQHDGMILVKNHGKYGYLDSRGFEIIPCQYDEALHFSNGVACVKMGREWHFINPSGRQVLPISSDTPSYYSKGLIVISRRGKYGAVNLKGEQVIPLEYDYLSHPGGDILLARRADGLLLLQVDGKVANPGPFTHVPTSLVPLGIEADRMKQNYWTSHDSDVWENSPDIFDSCPELPGVVVGSNGLKGYLGEDARQVVPCVADDIQDFNNNFYDSRDKGLPLAAQYKGKWGLFDRNDGSVLLPFRHEYISANLDYFGRCFSFKVAENVKKVIRDNESNVDLVMTNSMGVVEQSGAFVVPMEYSCVNVASYHFLTSFAFHNRGFDSYPTDTYVAIKLLGDYFDKERYHNALVLLLGKGYYDCYKVDELKNTLKDLHFIADFIQINSTPEIVGSMKVYTIEWRDGAIAFAEQTNEVICEFYRTIR